jgi:N-acetylglucosamine malate deacetylase 1
MNTLFIVPHADDEALGCGGTIARYADEGHAVHLVVATVSDVHRGDALKATAASRLTELHRSCDVLGVRRLTVLDSQHENRLDALPRLDLIKPLDALLREADYDQVFFPSPSHHQDHRVMYDVSLAALRPGGPARFTPHLIAAWSYTYTGWADPDPAAGFLYVDISNHLERKVTALRCYASQLPPPPHPISPEAVRALATLRGVECGCAAAERHALISLRV